MCPPLTLIMCTKIQPLMSHIPSNKSLFIVTILCQHIRHLSYNMEGHCADVYLIFTYS